MPRLYDDSTTSIVATILREGPISRAELSRRLNLSGATVTRLVRPLVEAGLVNDEAIGSPRDGIGRPTQLLEVPSNKPHFMGVNIAVENGTLSAVATDVLGRVQQSFSEKIKDTTPEALSSQIAATIRHIEALSSDSQSEVAGTCVSISGAVKDGFVLRNHALDWDLVNLAQMVESRAGRPVLVANDLAALTVLEQWFGLGRTEQNFVVCSIGAGIGHGLVQNSRLVAGSSERLGPTQHMPLGGGRGLCNLGHVGCAAGSLTTSAVLSRALAGRNTSAYQLEGLDDLIALADQGDRPAQTAIRELVSQLAVYINTISSVAIARDIVLDGEGVALLKTPWAEGFQAEIESHSSPWSPTPVIHLRSGTFERWAQGSAVTAMVHWLEDAVASLP